MTKTNESHIYNTFRLQNLPEWSRDEEWVVHECGRTTTKADTIVNYVDLAYPQLRLFVYYVFSGFFAQNTSKSSSG